MPAPATAVVKNSRLEVTPYFLSDEEAEVVALGVEDDELELLELSEEELLLLPLSLLLLLEEESEALAASFLSDFSDELSLSFLEAPPLLGLLLLPPLA